MLHYPPPAIEWPDLAVRWPARAQAHRMNAAQPKEAAKNEQRRNIMCVQPCAWCRRRKWALLNHATSVQSSRLSWCQNNRETRAGAMGCLPHARLDESSCDMENHKPDTLPLRKMTNS
jgi:hypothetical protein